MVKDPICGMEIEKSKSYSKLDLNGKEYLFCSKSCEEQFKQINGLKVAEVDIERKMIAYNTLKQLTVTVAHYIRNVNTAISAQAQLCEATQDRKTLEKSIAIIKSESAKLEAIVTALLAISDIKLQKYVGSEDEALLDLGEWLKKL